MKVLKANISNIIKSSVIDGPGNRMVIFFQGCNLNCKYCHNPHTIGLCNLCGECVSECPTGALEIIDNKLVVDDRKCIKCDKCIDNCPENSSPFYTQMSVAEIIKEIESVNDFISGITVSGGECMLQADFLKELFMAIRNNNKLKDLNIFIDSNGNVSIDKWNLILQYIDGVMLDLKAYSKNIHKKITGFSNEKILESIKYIDQMNKLEGLRIVIVKKYNDIEGEIVEIGEFLHVISDKVKVFIIKMRKHGIRQRYNYLESPSDKDMDLIKIKLDELSDKSITII